MFQTLIHNHRMKKRTVVKLMKYLRRVWKREKRKSKPKEYGECVYCEILGRLRYISFTIIACIPLDNVNLGVQGAWWHGIVQRSARPGITEYTGWTAGQVTPPPCMAWCGMMGVSFTSHLRRRQQQRILIVFSRVHSRHQLRISD